MREGKKYIEKFVNMSYKSIRGRLMGDWIIEEDGFRLSNLQISNGPLIQKAN